jgi:hypothetical protein
MMGQQMPKRWDDPAERDRFMQMIAREQDRRMREQQDVVYYGAGAPNFGIKGADKW